MVLRAFWTTMGPLVCAIGVYWGPLWASKCIKKSWPPLSWRDVGLSVAHVCIFSSPLLVLAASKLLFSSSGALFGSILSSRDDRPNLENLNITEGILRLLIYQRFEAEDGLESALGLYCPPFGCSWGCIWCPFWASKSTTKGCHDLTVSLGGPSLVSDCLFFSPLLVLPSSKRLLTSSWALFGSILGLQDDPPTFKNLMTKSEEGGVRVEE